VTGRSIAVISGISGLTAGYVLSRPVPVSPRLQPRMKKMHDGEVNLNVGLVQQLVAGHRRPPRGLTGQTTCRRRRPAGNGDR
jgi:hypothetical protein